MKRFITGIWQWCIILIMAVSCRPELDRPTVNGEVLTPLVSTSLTIQQIIPDSLRKTENDSSITLVFSKLLHEVGLTAFDPLETDEYETVARLSELVLDDRTVIRYVSLGTIAENSGPLGQFIISQHGSNSPIPPIQDLSYGPIPVDGSDLFQEITLDSGKMDVVIDNDLPTGISDVIFEIRNAGDSSLVGQETFTNVPAGGSATRTIDLAGKTLEGSLYSDILSFDVDGTNGNSVEIDTSDLLTITVLLRDMDLQSATAIFPAQTLSEVKDTTSLKGAGDLRLIGGTPASGILEMRMVSTIQDTLYFEFFVPESDKNGQPLRNTQFVPPAPPGGSVEKEVEFSIEGYYFDLTGAPLVDTVNTYYSELRASIDSTGKLVTLKDSDSVLVYLKMRDFVPAYLEGYLGYQVDSVGPEIVPVEVFKSINAGSMSFEDISIDIRFLNKSGIPWDVNITELNAVRGNERLKVDLSTLPKPLFIDAAINENTPSTVDWNATNKTTNLDELVALNPTGLEFEMNVVGNPSQNNMNRGQFAYDTAGLSVFADLNIPLNMVANGLALQDTVDFDGAKISKPELVESGTLYFIVDNGFPLSTDFGIQLLDEGMNLIADLSPESRVEAAEISGERVTQTKKSVLQIPFDESTIDDLLACKHIIMRAEFNTGNSPVKIFSDYKLDATISARFNYLLD